MVVPVTSEKDIKFVEISTKSPRPSTSHLSSEDDIVPNTGP